MSTERECEIGEITKRLDAILHILLESVDPAAKKLRLAKRVEILYESGLKPSEIARILGKTRAYVNTELGRIRARSR